MSDTAPTPAVEAGCPGARTAISGRAERICAVCPRWGQPGPQLQPAAKRGADGVMRCPNNTNTQPET